MKKIIQFVRNHATGTICVIALIAGYVVAGWLACLQPGDWGTWTGGIGTVGTLIGTIWLASGQSRKAARAEITLARLHAVGLIIKLQAVANTLRLVCEQLESISLTNHGPIPLENASSQMASIQTWTLAELLPLSPLPDFIAAMLAGAKSRIDNYKIIADAAARETSLQIPSQRVEHAKLILEHVKSILEMVEKSRRGCLAAAEALYAEG